jgi:hypothetical protein
MAIISKAVLKCDYEYSFIFAYVRDMGILTMIENTR